ncbi:MAG TPA: hypothetical protein VF440_05185 [Novosphingobium sp.]
MFDISAFLSLKPATPGLDPVSAQGTATADFPAFGAILAGQVGEQAAAAAPTPIQRPVPGFIPGNALPLAGNRQGSGNILPDGLPVLPGTLADAPTGTLPAMPRPLPTAMAPAPLPTAASPDTAAPAIAPMIAGAIANDAEMPQIPVLPVVIVRPAKVASTGKPLTEILTDRAEAQAPTSPAAQAAQSAAPMPAQAAARIVAGATGKRAGDAKASATDTPPETVDTPQDDAPTASAATATPEARATPVITAAMAFMPQLAMPALAAPTAEPASPAPARTAAVPAQAQPVATSLVALAVAQPAIRQAAAPTPGTTAVPAHPSASKADATAPASAAPAPLPVLTVAGTEHETPPALQAGPIAVQATSAAIQAAPQANRFRVVAESGKPAEPSEPALIASHAVATKASAKAEAPALSLFQPAPGATDGQVAFQPAAPAPAGIHYATSPAQPSHDFAGLVDRLIEARDAAATQSVQASIAHADFGQVSLHFQHDDAGLTVAMSSADPDFAPAVQAAMPAQHGGMGGDSQQQNAGQSQSSQSQSSQGGAAAAQQDASGQRGADTGAQARTERNARAAANASQPERDDDPRQSRNGIFA